MSQEGNKVPGHGSIKKKKTPGEWEEGEMRKEPETTCGYEMRTNGISDIRTCIQTQDPKPILIVV